MTVPSLPTFYQAYAVAFQKVVNVQENVAINKLVQATAIVHGNLANANADAKAFGIDTLAETLTLTAAIQGHSSAAFSESTSATNGSHATWGIY